jgi:hypothetical protein
LRRHSVRSSLSQNCGSKLEVPGPVARIACIEVAIKSRLLACTCEARLY